MDVYVGVDVGAVTAKFALVRESGELVAYSYLRTHGQPVTAVQQGLRDIQGKLPPRSRIKWLGVEACQCARQVRRGFCHR